MKRIVLCLFVSLSGGAVTMAASVPVKPTAVTKAPPPVKGKAGPAQPYHLPPLGMAMAPDLRQPLEQKLRALEAAAKSLAQDPLIADVTVLLKAVRYAFINSEIYVAKDGEKVRELLQLAEARLTELKERRASWPKQTGTLARGFISGIDGSPQPIGLEIPPDLNLSKPVPLTVWLHGRGDKNTDLHFIADRLRKSGQFQPGGGIILHPFGRQCLGYQLAGETDVLEAIEAVKRFYKIDDKRILLAGFSMGGAGAWHIGAHYADQWCALHAGAGFVDVKRFLKLTPEMLPPAYVQTLWGQYDVPGYVRNLFNLPVLAYSGEVDGQKLAADIMAEAFQTEGRKLDHRIGPGMGHKYHTNVLKDIQVWAHDWLQKGQTEYPKSVHWQGRTLKYARMFWLSVSGLQKHWEDSRVDAEWEGNHLKVTTKNVTRLQICRRPSPTDWTITINGQALNIVRQASGAGEKQMTSSGKPTQVIGLEMNAGRWQASGSVAKEGLQKVPDLQGPMDDAFMSAFIVVPPDKLSMSAIREAFYKRELAYTVRRWREVFRGDLPVKRGPELTAEDIRTKNLVFFGEPENNSKLAEVLAQTPITWKSNEVKLGARSWKGESLVPLAIYPNPKQPNRYIVLNSGPTIREKSDPNNSLQTPQLPDWTVLDVSAPATDSAPAKIEAAGFFDERWRVE